MVDAVSARTHLDLRLGAAFTRLQSLSLQPRFGLDGKVISYGQRFLIALVGFVSADTAQAHVSFQL
jgi:DNA topoisomerase IA